MTNNLKSKQTTVLHFGATLPSPKRLQGFMNPLGLAKALDEKLRLKSDALLQYRKSIETEELLKDVSLLLSLTWAALSGLLGQIDEEWL